MVNKLIKAVPISVLAAIIIEFVLYFFQLIMPNALFEGNELIVFIIISLCCFVIYNFLPSEDELVTESAVDSTKQ